MSSDPTPATADETAHDSSNPPFRIPFISLGVLPHLSSRTPRLLSPLLPRPRPRARVWHDFPLALQL